MKRCPQCDQTYNDESLNFCLMDGAALVAADSEPTVVIERPAVDAAGSSGSTIQTTPTATAFGQNPPVRRRGGGVLLWVGIGIGMIAASVVVAGVLLYFLGGRDRLFSGQPQSVVNALPTPKHTATPRPSPSPSPVNTPEEEASETPDDGDKGDVSDEITPIAWNTSAAGFKNDVGMKYRFECPPDGTSSVVWGSDIYTADSSICTAAVHAGVITFKDGGVVTIEFRPGRQIYGSTERNGVTTHTFGEYSRSFVFVK